MKKLQLIKVFLMITFLLLLNKVGVAAEVPMVLHAGITSTGLVLGYDPATKQVTGYYSNATMGNGTDDAPQFTCTFYFYGQVVGTEAKIISYYPEEKLDKSEIIPGVLTIKTPDDFVVSLQDEHGGCGNVEHFADKDQPAEFNFIDPENSQQYPWIAIRVIKNKKAYFYGKPNDETSKRKAYVVLNDVVGVRQQQANWLDVDFINTNGKKISGWVPETDFYKVEVRR